MNPRATKRMGGAIRNIANQLAQIATGWEASFDGPMLLREPTSGIYVFDLVRNASSVNGREANLGMATILYKWIEDELRRLNRNRDWLIKATVAVAYQVIPSDAFMDSHPGFWTSEAYVAQLSATVMVATSDGAAEASFQNAQAVIGRKADPGRPVPDLSLSNTDKGRPFQIKRTSPGKPRQNA